MKLAWFGPLPPVRSGIAHYASLLVPALSARHEIACVSDQVDLPSISCASMTTDELSGVAAEFDAIFCQLGNNPFHEGVYRWALENPAVVVLHDLILHHLIVELTLARGDAEGYIATLRENHGTAGAAWAAGRAMGAHGEIGNFLYPCFRETASRARHLVVHNAWAARQIRAAGIATPLTIAGHPWERSAVEEHADVVEARARFRLPQRGRIISMLGFVTAAKRPEQVFRAFAAASNVDAGLHLLVAGQPAPGMDLDGLARESGIVPGRWTATGYLDDRGFDEAVIASDAVVNLRYPSAGETSGPLVKVIGAEKDIAVSDYAQFSDLPPEVAVRVPLGEGEHDALVSFMLRGRQCDPVAQRRWVNDVCSLDAAVSAYERAAAGIDDLPMEEAPPAATRAIPLFVAWEVSSRITGATLEISLRLKSKVAVRSLEWGRPGYRVIADVSSASGASTSSWLPLSRDVQKDGEVRLHLNLPPDWSRVELRHALEGIPDVPRAPFAAVERPL